ncbi:MAG: diguanylate cyclase [Deltaproteobacteria bacterium GWA2_38_16]|nr:MAG: diguanylate cyclase [Deltaproteobacteria bacterium GWA2_38_16]OGQ03085.1 MAG: diguanylate cyclase [Deltaproteobacteria bacterium RIFCSPHIGHO2_02_FULL_38_15]OGQ33395.1 MAG: diguanylate cyclase [Deltaproteobacteria bacterium RIFCSPLOWO2_01_FULL_38_9]HBQ20497.1 ABC transporter permease [Deltaproteobacteria bacterium]
MLLYLSRRFFQTLFILFILSIVIYYMLGLMPGDPVELLITANPKIKAEDIARLKKVYGLDKPIYVRYFKWLKQVVVEHDLGFSRTYKKPTVEIIEGRVKNTFFLMLGAFLMSILIAVPIGIYSAINHYSKLDFIISILAFIGISVPSFWLGLMLIAVFSEKLGFLPAGGIQTIGMDDIGDKLKYMILPITSLSVQQIGSLVRYVRSSMLEVIQQDYLRTARAKGLDEDTILYKHALRNALIPVITILALSLPGLVSGAVITETIFAWPGMGRLLLDSVLSNDYYVAMLALLFLAVLTMASNFVADILYAIVDPRIRMGRNAK